MKVVYYLIYGIWYLFSLLPLGIHYVISDGLYLVIYRLLHYRIRVVRKNICDSFPEKSEQELRAIERDFYHWFCDYLVETVKLLTISEAQLKRRMVYKGLEQIDQCVGEGQSVALYLGHYCNWEWVTSVPLWMKEKAVCGQIYHALEDSNFDRILLRLRQRFGAVSIPMAETLRRIVLYRQQKQQIVIGYISDQVPFWNNIHHWCQFLNHDTPVLTGTERLVRQVRHAVFYLDIRRVRRGYYEAEFKLITREPEKMEEYQITDIYFHELEKSIRREPACYLWSHNRWKRTREEFDLRYDQTTGRVDIISSVEDLKAKKGL